MKNIIFVNIPNTGGEYFENNFANRWLIFEGVNKYNYSVGVSWTYPTQIKGWRDWDFTIQTPGEYRDVDVFNVNDDDALISVVRNPFDLLYTYFKGDWADFRKFHNVDYSEDDTLNFQRFVDIYLDDTIAFHAPAFKKSLFSQLKDTEGKWLINSESIIFKFENLQTELENFSKIVKVPLSNYFNKADLQPNEDWQSKYRPDQLQRLEELWKEDLEYFDYTTTQISLPTPQISKPKIAICFSGHVRDLERTKDYWTEMIKKYDMDVYASFWDEENEELGDTINNFRKLYSVKKIEVDSYESFHKSTLSIVQSTLTPPNILAPQLQEATKRFGQLPMWYKIWKANMMTKELGIDYDIVVRARTDSFFLGNIDIVDNDMLNVPIGRNHIPSWHNSEGINDIFAYGSPKMMDYYSLNFLHMMQYLNMGYYPFPPEHFLKVHMSRIDTNVRFIPNYITITRTSKGGKDEIYNGFVKNLVEEIIPTKDMNPEPNTLFNFVKPIKDSMNL